MIFYNIVSIQLNIQNNFYIKMSQSTNLFYNPSQEALKRTLKLINEGDGSDFELIRNTSLDDLTKMYYLIIEIIEKCVGFQYEKELDYYYKTTNYEKKKFVSKEELLSHLGILTKWLYNCDLGRLDSNNAMLIISKITKTEKYAFFYQFGDYLF